MKKMTVEKLIDLRDLENWELANITYKQSNFNKSFTKTERTYRVRKTCNYFQHGKISSSIHGDCLDGIDLGVRLDLYNWSIEKIKIVK